MAARASARELPGAVAERSSRCDGRTHNVLRNGAAKGGDVAEDGCRPRCYRLGSGYDKEAIHNCKPARSAHEAHRASASLASDAYLLPRQHTSLWTASTRTSAGAATRCVVRLSFAHHVLNAEPKCTECVARVHLTVVGCRMCRVVAPWGLYPLWPASHIYLPRLSMCSAQVNSNGAPQFS